MNTMPRIGCTIALIVAAACPALAAGQTASVPTAIPVSAVTRDGAKIVTVGASRTTVLEELGPPFDHCSDCVWVYPNYHANEPVDPKLKCTTLVVTFEDEHVSGIALVNRLAAQRIADGSRKDPTRFGRQLVARR